MDAGAWREHLLALLGDAGLDGASCAALATHLAGGQAEPGPAALFATLAAAEISAASLLRTLVAAQELELERRLPEIEALEPARRCDELRLLVARHGALQAQWVAACDHHHAAVLAAQQAELDRTRDELLREQTLGDWQRRGQLDLLNYFHELQVPASARVLELSPGYVTIARNPRVLTTLAAGERGRTVYALTRDPTKALLLERHGIRDDVVVLRIGGVHPHPQGARRRLRVSADAEARVTLQLPDGGASNARVTDCSVTGMGLEVPGRLVLPAGAHLRARGRIGRPPRQVDLDLRVLVRWVTEEGGRTRLGLELQPGPGQQEALDRLVRDYEQEAIRALNLLADD